MCVFGVFCLSIFETRNFYLYLIWLFLDGVSLVGDVTTGGVMHSDKGVIIKQC